MKYIISKTEPFRKYFGMGTDDINFYCRDLYTLFDLSCVEISEPLFDTIYPTIPAGYEELTENEAKFGSQFFSEVKDVVKIFNVNGGMDYTLGMDESTKINFTLTDEIKGYIVSFMYRFAKEIIETEYNYRFKNLRSATELEQASWELQKHEANEWLTYGDGDPNHITPFLDYLAQEHGKDKTELANDILYNAEQWADRLSVMLVESQKLLKEFRKTTTVWDMNILYEKYFGIMMPAYQSNLMGLQDEEGRRIIKDENDNVLLDVNNPKFGNKLNF